MREVRKNRQQDEGCGQHQPSGFNAHTLVPVLGLSKIKLANQDCIPNHSGLLNTWLIYQLI